MYEAFKLSETWAISYITGIPAVGYQPFFYQAGGGAAAKTEGQIYPRLVHTV